MHFGSRNATTGNRGVVYFLTAFRELPAKSSEAPDSLVSLLLACLQWSPRRHGASL